MRKGYINKEVAEITGIKPSTIAYYTNQGFVKPDIADPKGRGTTRVYSKENIFEFFLIRELSSHGLTLEKIRAVLLEMGKIRHFFKKYEFEKYGFGEIGFEKFELPKDVKFFLAVYNHEKSLEIKFLIDVRIAKGSLMDKFNAWAEQDQEYKKYGNTIKVPYPFMHFLKRKYKEFSKEYFSKELNTEKIDYIDGMIDMENNYSVLVIDISQLWRKAFSL